MCNVNMPKRVASYLVPALLEEYKAWLLKQPKNSFAQFHNNWISVYERSLMKQEFDKKPIKWIKVFMDVAKQKGCNIRGVLPHYRIRNKEGESVFAKEPEVKEWNGKRSNKSSQYRVLISSIRTPRIEVHPLAFVPSQFISDELVQEQLEKRKKQREIKREERIVEESSSIKKKRLKRRSLYSIRKNQKKKSNTKVSSLS